MPRDTLFPWPVMMITIATAHKNKERGRPREFDIEQALDHANHGVVQSLFNIKLSGAAPFFVFMRCGYRDHHYRGRPREFDIEQALDHAMIVFRQKGYHAASLSELGEAMRWYRAAAGGAVRHYAAADNVQTPAETGSVYL
jgi:hypothetical protein